jgi:tetratricopeptide (TPR) repeat protein
VSRKGEGVALSPFMTPVSGEALTVACRTGQGSHATRAEESDCNIVWRNSPHSEANLAVREDTQFSPAIFAVRCPNRAYTEALLDHLVGAREQRGRYREAERLRRGQVDEVIWSTLAVNTHWQRDLSVSYDNVGDVLKAQDKLDEALKAYRDSLAIRERLAAADRSNTQWQRDVYVSLWRVADVEIAQGNLTSALDNLRRGLQDPMELACERQTSRILKESATVPLFLAQTFVQSLRRQR